MIDEKRRALSLIIISLPLLSLVPSFFYKIKFTRNTIVNKGGWLLLDSDS